MLQLASVASLVVHLQAEFVSVFSVSSDQVVIDSSKVSPSLFETEQAHQPQRLLVHHVLQSPDQYGGLHWTTSGMSTLFLY